MKGGLFRCLSARLSLRSVRSENCCRRGSGGGGWWHEKISFTQLDFWSLLWCPCNYFSLRAAVKLVLCQWGYLSVVELPGKYYCTEIAHSYTRHSACVSVLQSFIIGVKLSWNEVTGNQWPASYSNEFTNWCPRTSRGPWRLFFVFFLLQFNIIHLKIKIWENNSWMSLPAACVCTISAPSQQQQWKILSRWGFLKKNLTVVSLYDAVCVYLWAPDMNTLESPVQHSNHRL